MIYKDKLIINDEEVALVAAPLNLEAGSLFSINVYTGYFDPQQKIVNETPNEIKQAFELGVPVFYVREDGGGVITKSADSIQTNHTKIQLVSASYIYNGGELADMELTDGSGNTRVFLHFYESVPYDGGGDVAV